MDLAELKPCTLSDLEVLRGLSLQTFTEAFAARNDPEDFSAYLREAFSPETLRRELKHPETRFFLLFYKDELAGYAKLNSGRAQTELQDPEAIEVERFYVRKPFQGLGLGSWMLQEFRSLAREEGKSYLWLGVWEENKAAIRFYERHGFVTFGRHPYYIGTDRQMDWMMRLELPGGTKH